MPQLVSGRRISSDADAAVTDGGSQAVGVATHCCTRLIVILVHADGDVRIRTPRVIGITSRGPALALAIHQAAPSIRHPLHGRVISAIYLGVLGPKCSVGRGVGGGERSEDDRPAPDSPRSRRRRAPSSSAEILAEIACGCARARGPSAPTSAPIPARPTYHRRNALGNRLEAR